VLERVFQMEAPVLCAPTVPDPRPVLVHVRIFRMSRHIAKSAIVLFAPFRCARRSAFRSADRRRSVLRNVTTVFVILVPSLLRERRSTEGEHR
jgi:hypothetical protein